MRQRPSLWSPTHIKTYPIYTDNLHGIERVGQRHQLGDDAIPFRYFENGYRPWYYRLQLAWGVLTGRYDVLDWSKAAARKHDNRDLRALLELAIKNKPYRPLRSVSATDFKHLEKDIASFGFQKVLLSSLNEGDIGERKSILVDAYGQKYRCMSLWGGIESLHDQITAARTTLIGEVVPAKDIPDPAIEIAGLYVDYRDSPDVGIDIYGLVRVAEHYKSTINLNTARFAMRAQVDTDYTVQKIITWDVVSSGI